MIGAGLLGAGAAWADEVGLPDWTHGQHADTRLVALGPGPDLQAPRRAALEIRLDPGYLTYWRQPGEAGLPPTLDTAGSQNVASVAMAFPAPHVFEEAGTQVFGYRDDVVFPLAITLKDPSQPATLAVTLDYALCAAICLPGKAQLSVVLPRQSAPAATALVDRAEAAVPRPVALGGDGPLALVGTAPARIDDKPGLTVTARGGPDATLFVEGPEGWFFTVGAAVRGPGGTLAFPVAVADRPAAATGAVPLTLTLVDGVAAITAPAHMDGAPAKP